MLYNFLSPFADQWLFFNLFRYLTFRTGGAIMTAMLICFVIAPSMIAFLKKTQISGQPIRLDGPPGHLETKQGTPTMGGLMMLIAIAVATLLWADITNPYVWIVLGIIIAYGAVGFWDDYIKVTRNHSGGLSMRMKFSALALIALVAAIILAWVAEGNMGYILTIPFLKTTMIPLGFAFPLFGALVIMGSGHAVNLTDGLDGLAIVPVMIAAVSLGFITYLAGNVVFADYLQIHHISGSGELAVICGAILGAGLGFLWFNAPPAMVFMGDTGSLALGGALGAMSIAAKHELVLAIIGGLFVVETVSVIVQIVSYKMTRRRVFRMAPLHHHFEQLGWPEATIVIRFWIISFVLALIGLSTLKLR